jgi:L-ascorbate metabolism protein UlaG (beta-lactamase superfamily)
MRFFFHVLFVFLLSFDLHATISWGWSGIAGVYLTDGKTHLFFDPVFSRPSIPQILLGSTYEIDENYVRSELTEMGISKLDGIFIGHSHFDHSLDMHVINKMVGGKIHGTQSTAFLAEAHGLRDDQYQIVKNGDEIILGDFKVRIVDSEHGKILGFYEYQGGELNAPLGRKPDLSDYVMGGSFSFYVTHPEGEFFVHQASRTSDEIKKLLKDRTVDILFQGIANRKSSQDLYEGIVNQAKEVKLVVPIHHDNFFLQKSKELMKELWGVNYDEFLNYFTDKKIRTQSPSYNKIYRK